MIDHVFVLAGGFGTRLWPSSKAARPKQFLRMKDGKSLLLRTIERSLALNPRGHVFIIALKSHLSAVIEECSLLERGREKILVLPEPVGRNTAPAIAMAVSYLLHSRGCAPGESCLVLPADHLVSPLESFLGDVGDAEGMAKEGRLVTFGIPPTRPETGYGYIEAGASQGPGYLVKAFKEKPDAETARYFVDAGNYYWNSGMFVFRLDAYWEELSRHAPDVARTFRQLPPIDEQLQGGVRITVGGEKMTALYARSPAISIDFAVMEKSGRSAMVMSHFSWNDVGSWDELSKLEPFQMENAPVYAVAARNNFIYSDLPVALCGVDDLIVVVKEGAVLVCKKGHSQLVGDVVGRIKEQGDKELL